MESYLNKISPVPLLETPTYLVKPSRNNIEYWARVGYCIEVAFSFSYPLVKFLFGNQMKWKLAVGEYHASLVGISALKENYKLFIDPICFVYNFDITSLYGDNIKYIEEKNFSEWYCINILGGTYDPFLDDINKLASY
jgi:hypothetical protein